MHMKRLIYVLSLTFMAAACTQQADYSRVPVATEAQVQRVEPLSWWTGMDTDLQILVQGPGIGAFDVDAEGKGLEVKAVHQADSPNFLFVDVAVKAAGEYNLVFSKGDESFKYPYLIRERQAGESYLSLGRSFRYMAQMGINIFILQWGMEKEKL